MALRGCDETKELSKEEKVLNSLIAAEKKIKEIKKITTKKGYKDILDIINEEV